MSKTTFHGGKFGHDDHHHDHGSDDRGVTLKGTSGDNVLTGTELNDNLFGGRGDDLLVGLGGNDKLEGGKGNDRLFGGDGNDRLDGGKGNDFLDGGKGNDFLDGGKGRDFVDGGAGNDIVMAGKGNDVANYTLAENLGAHDVYDGGKGIDTLRLTLTTAEADLAKDDIAAFRAFLVHNENPHSDGGKTFQFTSFDLDVRNFEALEIVTIGGNTAPVAVGDNYGAVEDQTLVILVPGVLANDSDAESSPLTASVVTGPANGIVTLNNNGSFIYTPEANFFGEDSFTYKAFDGALDSNVATVMLHVAPVNDAPVAVNDSATVAEDSAGDVIVVLDNDSKGAANESGQSLAVSAASASHGAVVINPDGTLSYTPNANYFGADTINYTVTDNGTTNGLADPLSDSAQVAVIVTEVNDAPVAVDDTATVAEDSSGNVIDVLGNDLNKGAANESGQSLAVIEASALHGAVLINPDGTLSYTPNADYFGADTINYTVSDNGTTNGLPDPLTDSAQVAVTVTGVNDRPVAVDDAITETAIDGRIHVAVLGLKGESTHVAAAGQLDATKFFAEAIDYTAGANWSILNAYDVVVLGDSGSSSDYAHETATGLFAELKTFVAGGGGVVTTGNFAFSLKNLTTVPGLDPQVITDADHITPITPAGNSYAQGTYSIEVVPGEYGHPIAGNITSYTVQGSPHEVANAIDGTATQLASFDLRTAIAYDEVGAGRTVYLGSMLTAAPGSPFFSEQTRAGDVDQIFEQAVAWAAGAHGNTGVTATIDDRLLLANDTDVDTAHSDLFISSFTQPGADGAAISSVDGNLVYTLGAQELQQLQAGQIVHDSFDYTVNDGNGATDTATVNLTINGLDNIFA